MSIILQLKHQFTFYRTLTNEIIPKKKKCNSSSQEASEHTASWYIPTFPLVLIIMNDLFFFLHSYNMPGLLLSCTQYVIERVTGRKTRSPQTEEIDSKYQTFFFFFSLLRGRRKQTTSVRLFFFFNTKLKGRFFQNSVLPLGHLVPPEHNCSQTLS